MIHVLFDILLTFYLKEFVQNKLKTVTMETTITAAINIPRLKQYD